MAVSRIRFICEQLKTHIPMEIDYDYEEGEKEEHVGVSFRERTLSHSTYEHTDGKPDHPSRLYKVVLYIDFCDIPGHVDQVYIPAECLDEFFLTFHKTSSQLIHIEPIRVNKAVDELLEYDDSVNPWGVFD